MRPPMICFQLIFSPSSTNARKEAITGSISIAIEIVEELTHSKDQLRMVCPISVGTAARRTKYIQLVKP
jgi:hypothetical protein